MIDLRKAMGIAFAAAVGASGAAEARAQSESAQPAANADGMVLHEVVVTARKRSENLQDVPIAISALTGEDLASKGISDSKQLFESIPNLLLSRRGAYVPIPSIRGVWAAVQDPTAEPSVAFYVDGVYVPSANQLDMSLLDIERVEVLRGPQGSLYGKNSLGGAINVISRKPTDELTSNARLSLGNHGLREGSISVAGPLMSDQLTGRLTTTVRRTDPYIYNTVLDRKVQHEDFRGAMLSLRATPTDALTVELSLDVMESDASSGNQDTFATSFMENCRAAPVDVVSPGCPFFARGFGYSYEAEAFDGVISRDIEARQDQTGYGGALTVTYGFKPFDLVAITGYRYYDALFEEDRDGSAYPIIGPFWQDFGSRALSQELRLVSTSTGRLDWTIGAYGFKDERDLHMVAGSVRPGVFSTALPPALAAMMPPGTRWALFNERLEELTDLDSTSLAAFAHLTYRFTDAFSLTAGMRYTRESREIELTSYCDGYRCPALAYTTPTGTVLGYFISADNPLSPTGGAVAAQSNEANESAATPLVTLSYQWTDDLLTYATASQGFKSGGYAPVFTFTVQPFESEEAWNYELGAKISWLDGRVTLNAAAFLIDWSNVQINTFTSAAGFRILNAPGGVENRGVELELTAQPNANAKLGLSYGYLDSQFEGRLSAPCTSAGQSQCSVHQSLRRTNSPRQSLSVFGEYTFALGPEWSLTTRADYTYRDSILYRIDSIGTASDPAAVNTGRLLHEASYGIANARIGLESERWSVVLWGKNLFDEGYYAGIGSFEGVVSAAYGWLADDRTYGVELSVRL